MIYMISDAEIPASVIACDMTIVFMHAADEVLLAVCSCWAIVRQHEKQDIAAMLFLCS